MLELVCKGGEYSFPILKHPVARVLKFQNIWRYFQSIPSGQLVLDYGSGDRPYEQMLRSKFRRYVAADNPDANAAHARRPDVHITDNKIDVDSGSADLVLLTEVLEHVYQPREALLEIRRILRPGGHLIGSVPFAIGEHEIPFDYFRYTSFCLRRLLEDTGFEVVELEVVGDMLGVVATTSTKAGMVIPKMLVAANLHFVAFPFRTLARTPELAYWCLCRIGLSPGKVQYFRRLPLGFTFCAKTVVE